MTVRDNHRSRAIAQVAAHLLSTGLAQTSLRQLAGAAGVSDRMLLYYFSDKTDVLAAAMGAIAGDLTTGLAAALPSDEQLPPRELVRRAAALTTQPAMRPFMKLWVEVVAAAARGEEPFVAIAAQIGQGFITWVEARLALPAEADRAATAAAIIAIVDGIALIDVCTGKETALAAVGALDWLLPG